MKKFVIVVTIIIFTFIPLFMKNKQNNNTFVLHETSYQTLGYTLEDKELLRSLFSKDELIIIIKRQITKDGLFPYLNYQTFELKHIDAYEEIRKTQKTTHQTAINLYNHPYLTTEFYNQIQTAINTSNSLILVNKNYHLAKDFIPNNLVLVDKLRKVVPGDIPRNYLKEEVYQALTDLFNEALSKDIYLFVSSGYRSYQKQVEVYQYYQNHQVNPDDISARAGHSEHQTGYAVDLTCKEVNYQLVKQFETTKEGQFIKNNAYKYGFIIRYLKEKENITGYSYEPWHLRYVGINVAQIIHNEKITLEEYLLKYTDMPI